MLFTAYGRIVDIVHTRSDKMRCKAFIVFREIQEAAAALRGLNGFVFYGRPLSIAYANSKSKAIALLEGTYGIEETDEEMTNDTKRTRTMMEEDADEEDTGKLWMMSRSVIDDVDVYGN
jgi:RNA recognition motif-containing protein